MWSCRTPTSCPLNGQCLDRSIIYQACVTNTANNTTATYVGLTEGEFKTRYNNHTATFRNNSKRSSTELSNHIWNLKDKNISYTISWKVLQRAKACQNGSGTCGLCLTEKYIILFQQHMSTLNNRSELVSTCRHARKFMLAHAKI